MIAGRFKYRAQLALLAILLIIGGWNVEALFYLMAAFVFGLTAAAVSYPLLRYLHRAHESSQQIAHPVAAGFATVAVVVAPLILIQAYAPPLLLLVYALFFGYFALRAAQTPAENTPR